MTGAIFRSRNIIFEERMIHLAKQLILIVFLEEDNLFPLKPNQTAQNTTKLLSEHIETQPSQLGIALRPVIMQDLHCDNILLLEEKSTQEQI